MSGTEYGCDRCGVEVPDGAGHYVDDDRLCVDCAEVADGETEVTA